MLAFWLLFGFPSFCLSCRINYNSNGYNGNGMDYNNGGYNGGENYKNPVAQGYQENFQGKRSSALQCYTCDANTCTKDMSTWLKVDKCGSTVVGNLGGACLKQVYTDNVLKKEVTVRKCIIGDKQDDKINFRCKNDNGVTSVCEVCTTDFCNSASTVNFSFVAVAAMLVAYLVPKYM